ncbi:MAG: hypothetical protein WCC06_07840 [Candidatus Aminicenantales bacterium]
MGKMKTYFAGKLFDINYRMAIHEGDANRRLASEAIKILLLPLDEVPSRYRKQFDKLRRLIEETIKDLPAPGLTPTRLRGIYNSTAAKYIKLLLDIQHAMSDI